MTAFPPDDFEEKDQPWFIEPKDKDPDPEIDRQIAFLARLGREAPRVSAVAIPNAGKRSDWERLQRWREGAVAGALDLDLTWKPERPDDRGVFFAEFKDGDGMPTTAQRRRLNRLFKQGHGCGVYRTAATLIAHLRDAGAPIDFPSAANGV